MKVFNFLNKQTTPKHTAGNRYEDVLPLICIRGINFSPGMESYFDVSREKSVRALEKAMDSDRMIFLAAQYDMQLDNPTSEDVRPYGVYAKVKQMGKLQGNLMRVMVDIIERGKIQRYISLEPYFEVSVRSLNTSYIENDEILANIRIAKKLFGEYMQIKNNGQRELPDKLAQMTDAHEIIDLICASISFEDEDAQALLATEEVDERLQLVIDCLAKETNLINLELKIMRKVRLSLDDMQKAAFINEQIKVLQEELGEYDEGGIIEEYKKNLEQLDLSADTKEKIEKEIKRLNFIPIGSAEAGVIQSYVETVLEMPWNTSTEENKDIVKSKEILEADHYGMDKVKERILEYLAVITLTDTLKSPIICLVGPPGVGKTSIAKSIARATGREYVRMSLGGIRDEAEIRGHRRTYVGAMPGRIIANLKQAGANNPLFLLDEIDKLSKDFRGDPASALLEALDPEQNTTFTDNYLEVPFDLSKVMFITTANTISTIPEPLLDRMETIELTGYIAEEKFHIARQFLLDKQMEMHGIRQGQLTLSDEAVYEIINSYTAESGVRELERMIAKICRKTARELLENNYQGVHIEKEDVEKYLSRPKHRYDVMADKRTVGSVNGLAWTQSGGDTMKVEAVVMKGSGKIQITGQLGDVMKESAQAAVSYLKSHAESFDIDYDTFRKSDIHIHCPEGAIPKDGPSAGITIATAVLSAFTNRGVSERIAMTGEITLNGRVLPIGGLREKLLAASRAKITDVILPKENEKDLEDVPQGILDSLKIHFAETIHEVFNVVFGV